MSDALLETGFGDVPDVGAENVVTPAATPALPPWTDAAEFCAAPCPPPSEIIGGILHQGCKLVFGGPSKARKSWTLLDLALSVATGSRWLNFPNTAAPVVFVNFELPAFSIHHRLRAIATAKQVAIPECSPATRTVS